MLEIIRIHKKLKFVQIQICSNKKSNVYTYKFKIGHISNKYKKNHICQNKKIIVKLKKKCRKSHFI